MDNACNEQNEHQAVTCAQNTVSCTRLMMKARTPYNDSLKVLPSKATMGVIILLLLSLKTGFVWRPCEMHSQVANKGQGKRWHNYPHFAIERIFKKEETSHA